MGKSSVSVKPYGHSSTSKWVVSYTKDSGRRREFFRTNKEAATRRDQILIELENLGNKAFAISDELRLEAVQCAERLAPFKGSLSDAVDFYLAHLEASRKSCTIAELVQGLLWASERGVLKYRNGCYYVVDKTANAIEGRQVNNKPFNQGMKSKALPGSKKSWPIGILEAAGFRNIALVEGIPDFLIAHHIIQTEQPEPNCAPVGMLGSSPHIHGAAVEHFAGKSVRIFAHDDPAGRRAASRWSQQLTEAGCQLVEVYELSAFAGVNDLYDYWSQHEALSGKWMPNT